MDLIELYFSHRRIKIILHGLYILMSVLLTQSILNSIGIRYMFPEKIDLAVWLAFVMNRNILMPLITFLIVYGCFNAFNKGLNYLLYRLIRARIPLFKGLRQGVTNMAVPLHWFKWANGKYERMRKYDQFKSILRSFNDLPPNVMEFAIRFNSVVLSTWLCLWQSQQGEALRSFYLVAGAAFYIYHVLNLLLLREVKANINFFREIERGIDAELRGKRISSGRNISEAPL